MTMRITYESYAEAQRRSAIRPGSQVYNHQDLSATFPLHSRDATHLGSRTTVSQSTLNGTRSISDGVANNTHSTFHVNGPNQEASHLAVGYADPSELAFPFMEPSLMTDPVVSLSKSLPSNFLLTGKRAILGPAPIITFGMTILVIFSTWHQFP